MISNWIISKNKMGSWSSKLMILAEDTSWSWLDPSLGLTQFTTYFSFPNSIL